MSSKLLRYTRKCHRASPGIFYPTLFALLLGVTASVEVFAKTEITVEWEKTFGGSDGDWANSIIQTNDGGFAIAGYTESKGAGGSDVWIIKLDSAGNQQWERTFGGSNNDDANSIVQTTDGGFIMAGRTLSKGAGSTDVWIIKLDNVGNQQWDRTFGGNDALANSIIQTTDGGFAVAGSTRSKSVDMDFWIIKLDNVGNQQWEKIFAGRGQKDDGAESIIQTTDNGFAVVGWKSISSSPLNFDVWVIKLDNTGNWQWDKTFGSDIGRSIIQTTDGYLVVAGIERMIIKLDSAGNQQWEFKTSQFSSITHSIIQTNDGGLVVGYYRGIIKLDNTGNLQWDQTFGENGGNNIAYSLIQTTSGGFAVAGYTTSKGAGNYDFWVIKFKATENHTLTVSKNGMGSGRVTGQSIDCGSDCSEEYVKNTPVSLTATPNTGSTFVGWNGACFGTETCQVTMNQKQQVTALFELRDGKRAAIIIHPKGSNGNNQEKAVSFMANYAYQTLLERYYDSEKIYLLSHKPDLGVNIVDAPVNGHELRQGIPPRDITVSDIHKAFYWAKEKGALNYPLVVIFVDHGAPDELILSDTESFSAQEFKEMLDDYQNSTNNQVVVILEACHTGTLVSTLAGENRVIISSTDENLAYYDELGEISFLKFYLDQLRDGVNFWEALEVVKTKLLDYLPPLNQQHPQLEDFNNGLLAKNLCLNGCFRSLPGILTLKVDTLPDIIPLGQPIDLTAYTSGYFQSVTASLFTPTITFNHFGYPVQPLPIFSFDPFPINTRRKNSNERWQGQVPGNELMTPGKYTLTVKAYDKGSIKDEHHTFCVESCDGNTQTTSATRLINISTRAPILGGVNNVIAGFVITGTGTQKVIIRGWGIGAGVDPDLLVQTYPEGKTIAGNNNWASGSWANEIRVLPENLRLTNPTDAGLLLDLPAGAYTAILSSVGNKGRGLIGVNEVESSNTIKLTNISTRAPIQGGADDVIAGFIITGTGNQKVLIRGWGFGAGVNPSITLYSQTGKVMAFNNDWQNGTRAAEISKLPQSLSKSTDAALLLELPAGGYTVRLSSVVAKGLGLIGVNAID